MINLWEYAHKHHTEESTALTLHREHVDSELISNILTRMAAKHGNRIILYGGQTATPLLFGYKHMRTYTNDLDFITREEDLSMIISTEDLKFDTCHGVFFGYEMDVIYTLTSGHIHNWEIPDDLISSSRKIFFGKHELSVCIPEYTIAMKFRRALENGCTLFGKDAIDIINLIVAPVLRPEIPAIEFSKIKEILREHCGREVLFLAGQIRRQLNHLPSQIRPYADRAVEELLGHIGEVFL